MTEDTNAVVCIYHANCMDGFGAAWVVREYFAKTGVTFVAASYGDAPPDVAGKHVIVVDFSYKRAVLEQMTETAASILVLDHHKTAEAELAGYPAPVPVPAPFWPMRNYAPPSGIRALFSHTRSGIGMAWEYFFVEPCLHGDVPALPDVLAALEDRDLWKFELPSTREIYAAACMRPKNFYDWSRLIYSTARAALVDEGKLLLRYHAKLMADAVEQTQRRCLLGGYVVPLANVPYSMASDAGHLLGIGEPFAVTYCDTPKGRVFSLRSEPDGVDVAEIAKRYGGGGHTHAAGFTMPLTWQPVPVFAAAAQIAVVPPQPISRDPIA